MLAQIKHMAIISDNFALLGKYYEAVFHMRTSDRRVVNSVVVGDGYLGLSCNPRRAGRQAGFDHFGFEVDDIETVFARLKEKYPTIDVLKRQSTRPFAGLSAHDPAGNVFDLSQKGMENRTDVYEEGDWKQDRFVHHFALRTVMPEALAQFYTDVFEMHALERPADDSNFYLTDGKVILIIMPWKINDYLGSGIERPALDHIGFKVENLEEFKKDLQRLIGLNPHLSRSPVGVGPDGQARLKLFSKCPFGKYHTADPDGVLIDVLDS